jgi:S-adenosylmethionine:tRNA ribosyltransferase-isomerase
MQIDNFNFSLPKKLIAQNPQIERSKSKLLVIDRKKDKFYDDIFRNIDKYFSKNDLIVINDTKVIPARIYGNRKNTSGKVEIFVERILGSNNFMCQVKSTRKIKKNDIILIGEKIELKVIKNDGLCEIQSLEISVSELLKNFGEVPLPPYISRKANKEDVISYQTVFAKKDGSVAAPTAALHFDSIILEKLKNKGVKFANLTLHIGMGTFSTIKSNDIKDHEMHSELYCIPSNTLKLIEECKINNGKIISVGTTVARALESFYNSQNSTDIFYETNIYIKPGYKFKVVDHLITNFHLPQSSLLVMVSAFYKRNKILTAYEYAIKNNYRFFSYGDSTLIL